MQKYPLNEIREKFLKFFEQKEHLSVPSFPLVPQNDNSLLLINAGMAPLKPYFLGTQKPPKNRMASCQKCIRTGDIENVGITDRHGTFFEMLGNFSFGDYFKKEAIFWAYEFMTEELKVPKEILWASVYEEDDEAFAIWENDIKLPKERIVRLGKEDNFWEHGLGPCGPCSEIYIDRGEDRGCGSPDCKPGCECDRYVEVWNLVFSQYDKQEDGSYIELPNPNIDTGMGLERLTVILNDANNIFEIEPIVNILKKVEEKSSKKYGEDKSADISIRLITDHIRTTVFMISDNILPSNEGRGYVLRRIIRRAYRHGRNLGYKGDFLADLCEIVISNFEKAYPELRVKEAQIKDVVLKEENKFQETLEQGIEILNGHIKELIKSNKKILSGKLAFQLYDTYGFPFELTLEILNENSLKADEKAFKEEMEAQRERARKARLDSDTDGWAFKSDDFTISKDVSFVGYNKMNCESKIISLIDSTGNEVDVLKNMQEGIVVIKNTPFYGESGGQIGDTGIIKIDDNNFAKVLDSKKSSNQKIYQKVKLEKGSLNKDSKVICEVDSTRRMAIARNHSATHLLHKALKEVLGDHVNQAGSLVEEDRLRFDFSHYKALDKKEIDLIEQKVNMAIFNALDINTEVKSLDEAKKSGAMALFSEKYADDVRVVSMGNYSKELCGGTHVSNTSQIQMFKLLSEVGIASGVRRIEAITGYSVYNYLNEKIDKINNVSLILKTKEDRLIERSNQLIEDQKFLQKEIESIKAKIAAKASENMFNDFEEINGIKISANILENMDIQQMRNLSDKLKDKLENSVIVLINKTDSNLNFLATATDSAIKKNIHCGKIISKITALAGGKGGGRPNMAQGGAPDITKAEEALELSKSVIKEQINS